MNIIIFQEGYDPRPDANSICTKQIVNAFKECGDNVYILCDGVIGDEMLFSLDSSIIHVPVDKEISFYRKTMLGKINTIFKRCLSIPIWPIRFPQKVKKYVEYADGLISRIDNDTPIVLISVYRPAEMVEACSRLKKKYKELIWFVYSLDGVDSITGFKYSKLLDWREKKWNLRKLSYADYIIQMQSNYKTYSNSKYSKHLPKTSFVDLPLITNVLQGEPSHHKIKQKISLLYGGAFYKGLREPFYLLTWFMELIKSKDVEFSCYTKSPFQKYIDNVCIETKGALKRYDYIMPEEMDKKIEQADILVNIGNKSSSMVPSKLFVYMSSCKPIIHFVSCDDDSCLPYLRKYPRALVINQNDSIEYSVKSTLAFIDEMYDVNFSYTDLVRCFPENIPQYTVELIRNKISDFLDKKESRLSEIFG